MQNISRTQIYVSLMVAMLATMMFGGYAKAQSGPVLRYDYNAVRAAGAGQGIDLSFENAFVEYDSEYQEYFLDFSIKNDVNYEAYIEVHIYVDGQFVDWFRVQVYGFVGARVTIPRPNASVEVVIDATNVIQEVDEGNNKVWIPIEATSTPTAMPTATSTPTNMPTATSTPTNMPTATSTPTNMPTATSTPTNMPIATSTPMPTPTVVAEDATPVPTATATSEFPSVCVGDLDTNPNCATVTPTNTPMPTATPFAIINIDYQLNEISMSGAIVNVHVYQRDSEGTQLSFQNIVLNERIALVQAMPGADLIEIIVDPDKNFGLYEEIKIRSDGKGGLVPAVYLPLITR